MALPIDCELGKTCYIQNYVDHDSGPAATDFTCGSLTNDTHKGTDIGLMDMAAMRRGVSVLAAADGVVTGTRDGVPDISFRDPGAPSSQGRECGNGVVVRHPNGWETQYCHMKQGSILVQRGQKLAAGDLLGQVGLSGQTEFPHVHLSVRRNGAVVDPFSADAASSCGDAKHKLWQQPIEYVAGGLLRVGFADNVPNFTDIRDHDIGLATLPVSAPALVLWGNFYGGRRDDKVVISISGPGGFQFDRTFNLDRNQAVFFRASGRKRPAGDWPTGTYKGQIALVRDGQILANKDTALAITSQ